MQKYEKKTDTTNFFYYRRFGCWLLWLHHPYFISVSTPTQLRHNSEDSPTAVESKSVFLRSVFARVAL